MDEVKVLKNIRKQVAFIHFHACGAVDDYCGNCVFDAGRYCLFNKLKGTIDEAIQNMQSRKDDCHENGFQDR